MTTEVRVPALGESVSEATIATWFKKPGDAVAVDEMLCELETDKVTVEVPSPAAGVLAEIVAAEGETVGPNALLAQIDEAGAASAPRDNATAAVQPAQQTADRGEPKMAGKSVDVMVPTLGESVTEATVATWFKKPGDAVQQDEMLCELETDKVSVEVPAPASGVLAEILAEEGATVDAKARLAIITEGASAGASGIAGPGDVPVSDPNKRIEAADKVGSPGDGPEQVVLRSDVEDAPSAKKAMAEAGVSRDQVTGSGRDGRVMKEDVARAGSAPAPQRSEAPQPAPAPRAPSSAEDSRREERVKMTRLRATIARRLKDAQNTAAMLTTYNEVDMSAIMDIRSEYKDQFEKKHKVKLGFMSFFVKACSHALKEVPEVNAEIDGGDVVYKNFVHMGVAVGTPNGLVVPVVRDADQKSFAGIEKEIGELGARARDGKLTMADMQGGTFTISNGGVYGSLMSSPILNPPQSGILGMHKIQDRPVVVGGQIVIRPMMYLALSYDHRIVDGKGAVTFLVRVKEALEDPRRLLMDL
ncbi:MULTISPECIES: 2-oxoglutarate dehydrogenase complex dihydrolipoyllysine-residue succinyltransferase [unclassified Paracoccus (in: a-proteobacteria)]|uniref:2-oxoglutarate dehydrogenase complex dihydrolipoyllysine-residue succinyltransferase n=1 Tax=unclassified Paracoccus (in: a-proteobacteria) TaxID=2688777 RepID=UPI0015FF63AB|nr:MULTISPECIES: 2-oxoglutarate dehydrogenase complex dihydrolipoyllysine-residue succinyltransferase [unclassified Paracoccus (in: a-proteobacteria)]MBB1491008.1 2-oxoglutarate dehydrogenase complex dihydrolipoyllysine-residue succinyltransferase [Paracoccus sp. MC1854]MBB1498853.1 2-oxoglutarate dehydrogenase complex dihydrolipoyllysine-residue succinyltransferase [Paracoccus sp. MC1862]QQO45148.1 2-oxoglutarate dehydrogenase complex dihydrolipoyllysine-residue succinyltransferase [Paracoccus 